MNFLQKLWRMLQPRDKRNLGLLLILSIIVSCLETCALSAVMFFISVATNFGSIGQSKLAQWLYTASGCTTYPNFILLLGIGLIFFYIARAGIAIGHIYLMIRFAQGRYKDWSRKIFKDFLQLPYQAFVTKTSAKISQILFGATGNTCQVINSLLTISAETFTVGCIYFMLMYVNWKMTCVLTLLLAVKTGFIVKLFSQALTKAGEKSRFFSTKTAKSHGDAHGNFKMLKLLPNHTPIINVFEQATEGVAQSNILNVTLQGTPRFMLETIGFFILIGIILYVIYRYNDASNVISTVSLYALAFYRLLPSLNKILASYNQMLFSKYAVHDIYNFLQLPQEKIGEQPLPFNNNITIQNLSFSYDQLKTILTNVSLTIPKGQRIAFIGESGAGKSTLVDIIMGLYTPTSGSITVDGIPLTPETMGTWRNKIGYVPQSIYLFDGTVAENVVLGRPYDEHKLIDVLRRARIYDDLLTKGGIHTRVGDMAIMISGGQRQRIALARALYGDPELLVFDEATSALDHITESHIMKEIYALDQHKTIIIIAHRLTTVEQCDVIYTLEKGALQHIEKNNLKHSPSTHQATL